MNQVNIVPPASVMPTRNRRVADDVSAQEKHMRAWVEARKRERRVQIIPQTEAAKEIELARLESYMNCIGMGSAVAAIIAALALLIHYQGWWVLGVVMVVIGLVFWRRKREGRDRE